MSVNVDTYTVDKAASGREVSALPWHPGGSNGCAPGEFAQTLSSLSLGCSYWASFAQDAAAVASDVGLGPCIPG